MFAQEPTPTPTPHAGRSYSSGDLPKTPPPPGPQAASPVTFTDITPLTTIDFKHEGSPTSVKYLLETMGGGVAIFDYDNDGRMDLFFTNGALLKDPMPKGAVPDKSQPKYWNRLYHQKSDGSFEDVTERAGLKGYGYSMGVAAGDYDNDGHTDLYVTGYGENHLYHNNGDGTFTDVARKLGVAADGWSTSAGWIDYDRDGRLDLFVARYLEWDFEKGSMQCGDNKGTRAYCHPDNFKGATNILYHQKADGTFEDISNKAGIADPNGKGLGVAFADFDNDGWPDVFVANDSVRQSLYHNKRDGTFEDIAVTAGATVLTLAVSCTAGYVYARHQGRLLQGSAFFMLAWKHLHMYSPRKKLERFGRISSFARSQTPRPGALRHGVTESSPAHDVSCGTRQNGRAAAGGRQK